MILDKNVKVNINSRNSTFYKNKGYDVKNGDVIVVKIEDLYERSIFKVNVRCDNCNHERKMEMRHYNNNLKKYNIYLCNKCKNIKSKKTKLDIYGDENYNNKEQNKKTCMEKYGVEHHNKLDFFKEKIKKTKLEKYNDLNYNNIEKCNQTKLFKYGNEKYNNMEKNKKTCIEKYGKDNVFKIDDFREKTIKSRKKRLIDMYQKYNLIDVDYENYTYICNCEKNHKFEIPKTIFYNRMKTNSILCTICNPVGFIYSGEENILYNFIKENYNDEIIPNSRNTITPYELDVYLPNLNLAFEFNGIYWHSDLYRPNNYHLDKTNRCEEKNIRLIHIYEDDWNYKQEIVKSRILNLLGRSNRIFARKCEIKEINNNQIVREFLEKNHIQGFVGSRIKLGLFYKDEFISLMTFGYLRKSMGQKSVIDSYEMLRFCNKLNINVVGGASKLFKYFLDNYNPKEITSYADRSWSNGNLYEKLNFNFVKKTSPNYYYIVDNKRYHRFKFRKDKLIKDGFDKNKTEKEIMIERGFNRIYDSGNLKFIFKN